MPFMPKQKCSQKRVYNVITAHLLYHFPIEIIQANPEAMKLYKICQLGLQYMISNVSKLGDNVLLLKDYLKIENDKRTKLLEVLDQ